MDGYIERDHQSGSETSDTYVHRIRHCYHRSRFCHRRETSEEHIGRYGTWPHPCCIDLWLVRLVELHRLNSQRNPLDLFPNSLLFTCDVEIRWSTSCLTSGTGRLTRVDTWIGLRSLRDDQLLGVAAIDCSLVLKRMETEIQSKPVLIEYVPSWMWMSIDSSTLVHWVGIEGWLAHLLELVLELFDLGQCRLRP